MPRLPVISQPRHAVKDTLIAALTKRLAVAQHWITGQNPRVAVLEARLDEPTHPPKVPDNASKPPSQGQKQHPPAADTDRPLRRRRLGVSPTLISTRIALLNGGWPPAELRGGVP